MKSLNKEKLFQWILPGLLLVNVVVFSFLFYYDITRSLSLGDREKVGVLTFKLNSIQRKFEGSTVWSYIQTSSEIANRDTIRSFEESDALIHLDNHTKIHLDENSMIILDIKGKSSSISFEKGSIHVNSPVESENKVQVVYGDKKIELGNSESHLEKNKESLNVYVSRGLVKIYEKGKEILLKETEKAVISKDVKISDVSIKLLSPSNHYTGVYESDSNLIHFSWSIIGNVDNTVLQLSKTPNFYRFNSFPVQGLSSKDVPLQDDTYYWRISCSNQKTGSEELSEIRKLITFKQMPIFLHTPNAKQVVYYTKENPHVLFSWSDSGFTSNYLIEIAKSRLFGNSIVFNKKVFTNKFEYNNLSEGTYYWRVRINSIASNNYFQQSKIGSFRIQKIDDYSKPVLLNPRNKQVLKKSKGFKLLFNWRASRELESYNVQISNRENFSNIIFSKEIKDNAIIVSGVSDPGIYYWRVKGRKGELVTPFSEAYSFGIDTGFDELKEEKESDAALKEKEKEKESIENPLPIYPLNETIQLSNQNKIRFKWRRVQSADAYLFSIFKDSDKQVLYRKKVKTPYHDFSKFQTLGLGTFIWKIQAMKSGKEIGEESNSRFKFQIATKLRRLKSEDIKITSPEKIYLD
ncbi:MAG: FecR domain-containing protein [Leptospiraceae bacterium]|nr:FecR domain-containing protein [Leptospiraceae bacterium]MCP5500789.1 FecR domain-containing protein [Leptospiraceae bacterium]